MSGSSISVTDQHGLLAAFAAVSLAAAGSYSITLANDLALAGALVVNVPKGSSLTLQGNGHALTGSFVLAAGGAGTLVLNAANTDPGSTPTGSLQVGDRATVELARPDAAGLGEIFVGSGSVLRIDGAVMPSTPIALSSPPLSYVQLSTSGGLDRTIDLAGVAASAVFTTLDTGLGLTIPVTGGGSVSIELDASAPHSFLLVPDGAGGTLISGSTAALAGAVSVLGAAGAVLSIAVDTATLPATLQPILNPLSAAVTAGFAIPFPASGVPGGPAPTLPAVASGRTLEVIGQSAGSYSLPGAGAVGSAAFVSTVPGITLAGGAANNQLVAVTSGLAFTAGAGSGTVIAGGGGNLVSIPAGGGGQTVFLGGGADSVFADGGDDNIQPGGGRNIVHLGAGHDAVFATGADTIFGSTGVATISAAMGGAGSTALTFLGFNGSQYNSGTGSSTVVGSTGNDSIGTAAGGSAMVFLGSGSNLVGLSGSDTLVGNTGASTVTSTGSPLVFAETGPMTVEINASSTVGGIATVVGNPSGSLFIGGTGTFNGVQTGTNAPLVYLATGAASINLSAVATIVAAGPGLSVTGGAGGGVFLGSAGGHNSISAANTGYNTGTLSQILGGGDGDTLSAGTTVTEIQAGTGNETLIAGTNLNLFALVFGRASQVVLQGFNAKNDQVLLQGFPAGEAAAAVAAATTTAGSERLTLSDGTHIVFSNFTGLTAANFS